jgi:ADP-ribose pyrophosphatase YjhB (NUDIX family)
MKKGFKFCPKCGGGLKLNKSETFEHPQCVKCGFVFYNNAKPATAAFVINDKGEILLAKRGVEPAVGMWDFLGGFLEAKEHPEEGLRREVLEEIGAEIEIGRFLGFFMDVYNYDKVSGEHVMNIFYVCKLKSDNFKLDPEVSELGWFAPDKIPWKDLAFQNTRDALNYYLESIL